MRNTGNFEKRKTGFFRRQFQVTHTVAQDVFDWVFGVVMPVFCFAADPIVFKSTGSFLGEYGPGPGLMSEYKPFAYLLSFVCLVGMMGWLLWARKGGRLHGMLAGLFALGGVVSMVAGIAILPFSIIGLIFGIGIFGFTPLLTALVYSRNAYRAFKTPTVDLRLKRRISALAAVLAFFVPVAVNLEIIQLVKQTAFGDTETIRKNTPYLKLVAPITDFNLIVGAAVNSDDKQRKAALEICFLEIKGVPLQKYLRPDFD